MTVTDIHHMHTSTSPSGDDARSQPAVRSRASSMMKPLTAAKKLGIYLPATPEDFRSAPLSHEAFVALHTSPPEWLVRLRREGPHPRCEVARKLGITITALKKNDMDKPLTTAEIKTLLENQPEWLRAARHQFAVDRDAQHRVRRNKQG